VPACSIYVFLYSDPGLVGRGREAFSSSRPYIPGSDWFEWIHCLVSHSILDQHLQLISVFQVKNEFNITQLNNGILYVGFLLKTKLSFNESIRKD
jgi:hypothetical protein